MGDVAVETAPTWAGLLPAVYVVAWSTNAVGTRWLVGSGGGVAGSALPLAVLGAELVKLVGTAATLRAAGSGPVAALAARNAHPAYLLPGAVYFVHNCIAYRNVAAVAPALLQVLMSTKVLFSAAAAWLCLGRRLDWRKGGALAALSLAAAHAARTESALMVGGGQRGGGELQDGALAIAAVLVQCALNAAGGTANEWVYTSVPAVDTKGRPLPGGTTLALKNFYLYTLTSAYALAALAAARPPHAHATVAAFFLAAAAAAYLAASGRRALATAVASAAALTAGAVPPELTARLVAIALLSAAAGTVTSLTLRYHGNLTKSVCAIAESFVIIDAAALLLGDYPASGFWQLRADMAAVAGASLLYGRPPGVDLAATAGRFVPPLIRLAAALHLGGLALEGAGAVGVALHLAAACCLPVLAYHSFGGGVDGPSKRRASPGRQRAGRAWSVVHAAGLVYGLTALNKHCQTCLLPDNLPARELERTLMRMLDYTASFAEDHRVEYWLTDATLLGAVRARSMMSKDDTRMIDDDADIALMRPELNRLWALRGAFDAGCPGCRLIRVSAAWPLDKLLPLGVAGELFPRAAFLRIVDIRTGRFIDLFGAELADGGATLRYLPWAYNNCRCGARPRCIGVSMMEVAADAVLPTSTVQLGARTYAAPADPPRFLRRMYGDTWATEARYAMNIRETLSSLLHSDLQKQNSTRLGPALFF